MTEVITKALTRASLRGYDTAQTADLIVDYLDVAGLLRDQSNQTLATIHGGQSAGFRKQVETATALKLVPVEPNQPLQAEGLIAPPQIGRSLNSPKTDEVWKLEDLFNHCLSVDWSFSANPTGLKTPLEYKGIVAQEPNQRGVRVLFRCEAVSTPKEIPVFIPTTEPNVNPRTIINEVKSNVEQLFRNRGGAIPMNVPPPSPSPVFDENKPGGFV